MVQDAARGEDVELAHERLTLAAIRARLQKYMYDMFEERWMNHAWWGHGPRKQTHRAKKGKRVGMRGRGRRHP
jgi:hypothetical protein